MLKHELRKKYKLLRAELSENQISEQSLRIVNGLLKIPMWDFFYFHTFLSIPQNKEVDTHALITLLQGKDKSIVVPKVTGPNTLSNYLLQDHTILKPNQWNIPEPVDGIEVEPSKIEVVFVPLLAYDVLGNRIGYGKGFYDAFLQDCSPETLKVGLSFFEPEVEVIEDVRDEDIRLDYCVTPKGLHKF
ncbi:5-formyltetrahydrofolate cyclo-ligase [Flagellimonas allohymeniacidonis]|uniref:5-formyltetrahydrofolate cyclo-ligase n=1 Tax=Flagellimonas allohymeniacidonis TaxID=2517819 RepID=A0A4Q8QBQ9_9FLAO|nr:5-formyltetrahydrofolate cyclo-ligase [Allomuricauda hymeniacidonis]TAI47785.1 5-formyltetrahydrofolate cyclo-ligase [Allomuricauda hymeniacidonis]